MFCGVAEGGPLCGHAEETRNRHGVSQFRLTPANSDARMGFRRSSVQVRPARPVRIQWWCGFGRPARLSAWAGFFVLCAYSVRVVRMYATLGGRYLHFRKISVVLEPIRPSPSLPQNESRPNYRTVESSVDCLTRALITREPVLRELFESNRPRGWHMVLAQHGFGPRHRKEGPVVQVHLQSSLFLP